jgi:Tfp pilus assembly protein PilX
MNTRRNERGFALTTAMIVLMIMLMLAFVMTKIVDVQANQTGNETAGEAAFNVAESVLESEAHQVSIDWPTTSADGSAFANCNQASPQTVGCEGVSLTNSLASTYSGPDYTAVTWSAQVIAVPTGNQSYYSETLAATQPSYDIGDGRLWIRAEATVLGQTRVLVEQLVHQTSVLAVPDNTVTAGAIFTENLGNKVMIEARDPLAGLTGNVEVRCGSQDPPTQPSQGQGNCLGWSAGKGQLDPAGAYGAGYKDPNGGYQTLTDAQIQQLVQTAQDNNTYYDSSRGCPPGGTDGIVVVTGLNCSYTSNYAWNTQAKPGALIFLNGTLSLSGTETFYGVIYMANQNGPVPPCDSQLNSPPTVTIDGNAELFGAVFVDRCGVVAVGESGGGGNSPGNVNFSANALAGLYAADAARPAQNTFRVIKS